MKTKYLLLVSVAAILLSSCSSTSNLADDVYYNPRDEVRADKKTAKKTEKLVKEVEALNKTFPEGEGFELKQYTAPAGGVMAVSDGDTLYLDDFDYENGDSAMVVNNYYEVSVPEYYSYSSAINRFYRPYSGFGYYTPYYDPWYWGGGFSMNIGLSFGWGYPYYRSYYSPYYGGYYGGYYPPYYGGYYPPYYGGYYPPYVGEGYYSNSNYGHRISSATDKRISQNPSRVKSDVYYTGSSSTSRRTIAYSNYSASSTLEVS